MFHDIVLPEVVSSQLQPMRKFLSLKSDCKNGMTYRKLLNNNVIFMYKLQNATFSLYDLNNLMSFFYGRKGSYHSFLLKDFSDYIAKGVEIGVGNSKKRRFKLFKEYQDPIMPYKKIIKRPILESIKLQLSNGKNAGSFEFDFENSDIILAKALPQDIILYADFNFYIEVRFSDDQISYNIQKDLSYQLDNINLIEVI